MEPHGMARGRGTGFTLIEIMISIAILAIMGSIAVSSVVQFRGAVRERGYQRSLRDGQAQLLALRQASFDRLPPEVVKVGEGGKIRLSQTDLVAGSVKVRQGGKELAPASLSLEQGTLVVAPGLKGQSVVVDYRFRVGSRGEAFFAAKDGSVALGSARPVKAVFAAQGDKLKPLSGYRAEGATLKLPASAADGLVVVDFGAGPDSNEVEGQFLDKALQPSNQPTDTKMLTVREPYRGPFRMALSLIKVKP